MDTPADRNAADTPTPTPTPTEVSDRPNLSTEHQLDGDARRPSDTLDKGQPAPEEHEPRRSSLF